MPAHAIAVVGMAGRFPGADTLEDFWRLVSEGREILEAVTEADLDAAGVPAEMRNHRDYVRRGTFLERCEEFDAGFFGFAPREAQVLDPQHRVFLECAWEAIEHAGYSRRSLPESVGVYAGASMNTYVHAQIMRNPALAAAVGGYQLMLASDKDFLCTRVSYKLGLKGPSMTVQTACSTSLVAVQVACRALQRGECDMALAGGVSILFPQRAGYLYQEGMILSPDGHCRPFDAAAQGTRAGAGAGIVVLKRLEQALADGDTVHAVIRGIAVNNDGADKAGFTAPSVEGQVEVVATAQALAGVSARTIGYVEAHGTATPLGDPIEIAALTQAFRADTDDVGFCHLGSLKANLGHLDAAAGVAGLIKTVLALSHRELPPLVNFTRPNPALELPTSPFVASATKAAWVVPAGQPRRAGVSSFGIGGTNAHAVLEESGAPAAREPGRGPHLLVWSARSAEALDAVGTRLAAHLQAHPELDLADVAHTLQVGREAFAHRRAVVVAGREQAIDALRSPGTNGVLGAQHEGGARPLAFLFSGQGSQYAGMGQALYDSDPVYRRTVDECAGLLRPHLGPGGPDLHEVLFGKESRALLGQTRYTQPALFVTELALVHSWHARGVEPVAMLGHSIGELVAAHVAGVWSLPDALAVVAARGRLMQEQPAGRMLAVPLGEAEVQRWLTPGVEVAAVNAPGFVTLSGSCEAMEALRARMAQAGIEARALQTSHGFHSGMMDGALAPFRAVLETVTLSPPTRPFVSNVTGTWITPEEATSPAYWVEHLRRAVRFEAGMRTLAADASMQFLEVGPGQALSALARQNLAGGAAARVVASMRRPDDARDDAQVLAEATARLWLAGCAVEWGRAGAGGKDAAAPCARRRVPLPTYPFERQRHAVDPAPGASAGGLVQASGGGDAGRAADVPRSARIEDWFHAPTWTRDDTVPTPAAASARWLLLGDDSALCRALESELALRGLAVLHAAPGDRFEATGPARWRVRVDSSDDLERLVGEASREPLAGIVHLWALPSGAAGAWRPLRPHEPAYDGLVALALALPDLEPRAPLRLLHVTAGAESVLGEAVQSPHQALATGPVLVLPREIPGLQMRAVDLDAAAAGDPQAAPRLAAALADETLLTGIEPQVAHRAGCRWVRRYERLELPPTPRHAEAADPPAALRAGGCYLVTGGLGGMGLSIARWLGQALRARLVLTSRQGLPPRDTWDAYLASRPGDDTRAQAMETVRAIEAEGGQVIVAAADAADEAAMAAVLAAARDRFGPLHGVFHAAGVPGRGSLARRATAEEARHVFAPKIGGLHALCSLLGGQTLDLVVLFSSINAAMPAPGVCDYASANAVLDAFVDSAAKPAGWKQVVAIDWGAWREVGMAARLSMPEDLRAHWAAHLAGAISPADGIEALSRVIASRRRRVVVETYDVLHSHARLRRPDPAPGAGPAVAPDAHADRVPAAPPAAPASAATSRPALSTPYVAPASDVERRLAAIWEELLGVRGVGVNDDFFELGGHSLMFTRVLALIDEGFGTKLPLREVFDASTIRLLAERLPRAAPGGGGAGHDETREVLEL